jgi:hypothetical protein
MINREYSGGLNDLNNTISKSSGWDQKYFAQRGIDEDGWLSI